MELSGITIEPESDVSRPSSWRQPPTFLLFSQFLPFLSFSFFSFLHLRRVLILTIIVIILLYILYISYIRSNYNVRSLNYFSSVRLYISIFTGKEHTDKSFHVRVGSLINNPWKPMPLLLILQLQFHFSISRVLMTRVSSSSTLHPYFLRLQRSS